MSNLLRSSSDDQNKTAPLAEITEEALTLLYRELGVVDTVRFLNQYGAGYGDYTNEREALFADLTLEDIVKGVRGRSVS